MSIYNKLVSLIFILSLCLGCQDSKEISKVSFYKVPLECGAAPGLGCGSKSKPVLLGLEEQKDIKQARLNLSGSIIAIVWDINSDRISAAEIFERSKLRVEEIHGAEYDELLNTFDEEGHWLRGNQVDQLSILEAKQIADRLVLRINKGMSLPIKNADSLKQAITNILISRFTKKYSYKINDSGAGSQASLTRNQNELLDTGRKFLNDDEMMLYKKAVLKGLRPTEEEITADVK